MLLFPVLNFFLHPVPPLISFPVVLLLGFAVNFLVPRFTTPLGKPHFRLSVIRVSGQMTVREEPLTSIYGSHRCWWITAAK
jgi:hypothetical protein